MYFTCRLHSYSAYWSRSRDHFNPWLMSQVHHVFWGKPVGDKTFSKTNANRYVYKAFYRLFFLKSRQFLLSPYVFIGSSICLLRIEKEYQQLHLRSHVVEWKTQYDATHTQNNAKLHKQFQISTLIVIRDVNRSTKLWITKDILSICRLRSGSHYFLGQFLEKAIFLLV